MQTELHKLVSAIREFYARERHLLEKDLGERTLTHRLAVQVEKQFPGWEVDCDYNRLGERTLRLPKGSIVSTDDEIGLSEPVAGAVDEAVKLILELVGRGDPVAPPLAAKEESR